MKVSILIPCHNAAPHLQECIESAINQTYSDKEIILIDDGSTDNSLDIANEYSDEIKIISRNNVGQSITRNQLLELSTGDWIQYLDADDYLYLDKLNNCLNNIHESIDIIISCSNSIVNNELINVINPIYNLFDFFSKGRRIPTINYLFKKDLILDMKWEKLIAPTTKFIYDLIINKKPKILLLPLVTGVYRINWSENQQSKLNNSYTNLPELFSELLKIEDYKILNFWYWLISYSPYKYLTYNDADYLLKQHLTINLDITNINNLFESNKYKISNIHIDGYNLITDNIYVR